MKILKTLFVACLSSLMLACNTPSMPEPTKEELLEALKAENDSLLQEFDSLMAMDVSIPALIDSSFLSPECLVQFNKLASATGGEPKIVANSKMVSQAIMSIIEENSEKGADVMIMIDKTSSMGDDLVNIRLGLDQIINTLKKFDGVRLAVGTYGDKNSDGSLWYDFQNFENDFEATKNFIETIKMTHGDDFPESVYDGVYEAFQEGFWQSETKRMVVLIGDAPSLEGDKSDHTAQEIIDLATRNNINMNFYPIVLSPVAGGAMDYEPRMEKLPLIENLYPNPCRGLMKMTLTTSNPLTLEIWNQSGKQVHREEISSTDFQKEMYDMPSGVYIVRVQDEKKNFDQRKFILTK